MFTRITEKTFYQYVKCPHWVFLEHHGEDQIENDPLKDLLQDDGLLSHKHQEILFDRTDIVDVVEEDVNQAFIKTLLHMKEGRQTIHHGILIDQHWVGNPDVLEKVEGRSRLGNHYYVAADIKNTRYLKDEHKLQGCFYAELLEKIQGVRPVNGYIITPDKKSLSFLIEEFESTYELTLQEMEKIITGVKPTHFMTTGCKQSPWFHVCTEESFSCDDLSVLNRVWREEVSRLQEAGIKSVTQLAQLEWPMLQKMVKEVNIGRLEVMWLQAKSLQTKTHFVKGEVSFPKSSIEIYLDIESDPLRDFPYLFGVLKVDEKGEEYIPFHCSDPSLESKMWLEFTDFLAQHMDAPIYIYGYFEQEVLKRFASKYGVSGIVNDVIERNLIDVLEHLRPNVIMPLSFYSLKDIASYLGFHWRAPDASGANSVLWFEQWLVSKTPNLLQKILEYNEDDVRATYLVKSWLESLKK